MDPAKLVRESPLVEAPSKPLTELLDLAPRVRYSTARSGPSKVKFEAPSGLRAVVNQGPELKFPKLNADQDEEALIAKTHSRLPLAAQGAFEEAVLHNRRLAGESTLINFEMEGSSSVGDSEGNSWSIPSSPCPEQQEHCGQESKSSENTTEKEHQRSDDEISFPSPKRRCVALQTGVALRESLFSEAELKCRQYISDPTSEMAGSLVSALWDLWRAEDETSTFLTFSPELVTEVCQTAQSHDSLVTSDLVVLVLLHNPMPFHHQSSILFAARLFSKASHVESQNEAFARSASRWKALLSRSKSHGGCRAVCIEEFEAAPLLSGAAFGIANGSPAVVRACLSLCTVFASVCEPGERIELCNAVLTACLSPNAINLAAISASSAPKSPMVSGAVPVVLQALQNTGSAPLSQWSEAVLYRNRQVLTRFSRQAKAEAAFLAARIAEQIFTAGSKNKFALQFCAEVAASVQNSVWTAAPLLVEAIVARLFAAAAKGPRGLKFPKTALDLLRVLLPGLSGIPAKSELDSRTASLCLDALVSATDCQSEALYLATEFFRQSKLDMSIIYNLLSSGNGNGKSMQGSTSIVALRRYKLVLSTLPIANLYHQVIAVLAALAAHPLAGEKAQGDAYSALLEAVKSDDGVFDSICDPLLARFRTAGATVADMAIQIVMVHLLAQDDTENAKCERLIRQITARLHTPGFVMYRRRAVQLLSHAAKTAKTQPLRTYAWTQLVRAGYGTDRAALAAKEAITSIFLDCGNDEKSLSRSVKLRELATTLLELQNAPSPMPSQLAKVLGLVLGGFPPIELRRAVKSLLALMLDLSLEKHEAPEVEISPDAALSATAVILESNATYFPTNKAQRLFDYAFAGHGSARILALRILYAALSSHPRPILGPQIINSAFRKLVEMLSLYNEEELEIALPLAWEVSKFTGTESVKARQQSLGAIREKSAAVLAKILNSKLETDTDFIRVKQLVLLSSGTVRYFCESEKPPNDARPLIKQLTSLYDRLVESAGERSLAKQVKLCAARAISRLCLRYPSILVSSKHFAVVDKQILEREQSDEWRDFMKLLFEHLQSVDRQEYQKKLGKAGQPLRLTKSELEGNTALVQADSVRAGLIQRFASQIEIEALNTNSEQDSAVSLLSSAVISSRLNAQQHLPALIALAATNNRNSNPALDCLVFLASHNRLSHILHALPAAFGLLPKLTSNRGQFVAKLWSIICTCTSDKSAGQMLVSKLCEVLQSASPEATRELIEGLVTLSLSETEIKAAIKQLEWVNSAGSTSIAVSSCAAAVVRLVLVQRLTVGGIEQVDYEAVVNPDGADERLKRLLGLTDTASQEQFDQAV